MFKGGAKFESGTGWPSFTAPFAEEHLRDIRDTSYSMVRTEIVAPLWRAPRPRLPRRPPRRPGSFFA
ncbi:peptide-methionine (R)-S-oxide reductase [Mesorhizobium sp.]|uniref:peptide-methionine (R)-S-oxide reductase n=1 Tax=Mesorhizobium sp. TaxID=1871066 RepID=UPI00338F941E